MAPALEGTIIMAKKVSSPPPARNRSRKKSAPRWPMYAGGIMGLFIISFLVGMYGLPRANPAAGTGSADIPVVPTAPVPAAGDRVKVTELPNASPRERPASPDRQRETRKEVRKEKPAETPAAPTPPAVSGATLAPPKKKPAPAPTAPPETNPAPTETSGDEEREETPAPSNFRVQAGSFQDEENARKMADRLASSGYQPSVTTSKDSDGTTYRVQVGPFTEKKEAEDAVRDLGSQGISARVNDD
jgi:DedD protein